MSEKSFLPPSVSFLFRCLSFSPLSPSLSLLSHTLPPSRHRRNQPKLICQSVDVAPSNADRRRFSLSLSRFRISASFRSVAVHRQPPAGRRTGAGNRPAAARRLHDLTARARFDEPNVRDGTMRVECVLVRERAYGKRSVQRRGASEHKACLLAGFACLPACLPPASCLLPCLVRRRTACGPHVVCLASGLFTC